MGYLSYVQGLIETFNWHTPSWDLFVLLFWLVASVLYAFAAGRGKIMTILVSIYMSKLIVLEAPFLSNALNSKLNINVVSLQQLAAFAILFIIFFIFLGRYAFKSSADSRSMSSLGFSLVFSVLQIGLLINIVFSYLPDHVQAGFSPLVQFLFLHPNAGFVWLLAPVIYLIALGRFVSDRSEL